MILGMVSFGVITCSSSGTVDPGPAPIPADTSYLTAPEESRDWLKQSELISATYAQSSPIHNGYFMPVGNESSAIHTFAGSLNLTGFNLKGINF